MDRRNLLMTMSGVVAGTALLALPRVASAQMTGSSMPGSAMPAGPTGMPTTGMKLGKADYMLMTLMGGSFAKETSQIALMNGANPLVKQFAQFEINEQMTMAQVLTDATNPPPAPLDAAHAAMRDQLRLQTGRPFDVAYIDGQLVGHQELLNIQQAYLNNMPSDDDSKHVAMLARTSIIMHMALLQDIKQQITA